LFLYSAQTNPIKTNAVPHNHSTSISAASEAILSLRSSGWRVACCFWIRLYFTIYRTSSQLPANHKSNLQSSHTQQTTNNKHIDDDDDDADKQQTT
jgi:hypothetical protein